MDEEDGKMCCVSVIWVTYTQQTVDGSRWNSSYLHTKSMPIAIRTQFQQNIPMIPGPCNRKIEIFQKKKNIEFEKLWIIMEHSKLESNGLIWEKLFEKKTDGL